MDLREQKALQLFTEKYNCSQSIFLAYSDLFNIDKQTALKISSGFGGGIAGMGETCGAINGAVMILGLRYGFTDAIDMEIKQKTNKIIREFIKEFNIKHKKINCRNLLTEDEGVTHKVHSQKCFSIIEEICNLLNKYLELDV